MNTFRLYLVTSFIKILPETRFWKLKCCLYRWAGVQIGKNVQICSSARICGNGHVELHDNVWINVEALIMCNKGSSVVMEQNSKLGIRSVVVTGFHKITPCGDCIIGEGTSSNIRICRGASVGTNTTILPGIVINEMAHVAAGAVVTKDVPAYCRVAGIPAKVIKDLRI